MTGSAGSSVDGLGFHDRLGRLLVDGLVFVIGLRRLVPEHVVTRYAIAGPGAGYEGQVDAALRGETPRDRRRPHLVLRLGRRLRGEQLRLDDGRGQRDAGGLFGGGLGVVRGRIVDAQAFDVLSRLADDRYRLADGHGSALGGQYLPQQPRGGRLDLHDGLVGLDLGDRLAERHLVVFRLEPSHEGALVHVVAHLWHVKWSGHDAPP